MSISAVYTTYTTYASLRSHTPAEQLLRPLRLTVEHGEEGRHDARVELRAGMACELGGRPRVADRVAVGAVARHRLVGVGTESHER